MNSKSKSAIRVIAYAIEKDTDSLKQLLTRNGIMLEADVSKDQLQNIVTKALEKSETFRTEFKNWVLERTNFGGHANATGFAADPTIGGGIGYTPGSSGAYQVTNSQTQQTFGGLTIGSTVPMSTTVPSSTTPPKTGTWSIDLNTILDFAKDGLNTYALALQTRNESTISNNALAIEREKINNNTNGSGKPNTTLIVVVAAITVITILGGVYYINTKK